MGLSQYSEENINEFQVQLQQVTRDVRFLSNFFKS